MTPKSVMLAALLSVITRHPHEVVPSPAVVLAIMERMGCSESQAQEMLLWADGAGIIILRHEAGDEGMTDEERALCPARHDGLALAWLQAVWR